MGWDLHLTVSSVCDECKGSPCEKLSGQFFFVVFRNLYIWHKFKEPANPRQTTYKLSRRWVQGIKAETCVVACFAGSNKVFERVWEILVVCDDLKRFEHVWMLDGPQGALVLGPRLPTKNRSLRPVSLELGRTGPMCNQWLLGMAWRNRQKTK